MAKTLEVNGAPARVVDGTVPKPDPIVEAPIESLLIQMAELDQKIEKKASECSKLGNQLKDLKSTREKLTQTLSARGEKLRRPEQSFEGIHAAMEEEDEIDD